MARPGPDPIDAAVAARIRQRRRQLELSQKALAEGLGVTFQQVQKYERGGNRVSASMLAKIAARLDTTVAALVGEAGESGAAIAQVDLETPGAREILAAFAGIEDGATRRALVQVARVLAGADHPPAEARKGPRNAPGRRRRQST
jgi:transcriptional regulator with XRE-family HTH domain